MVGAKKEALVVVKADRNDRANEVDCQALQNRYRCCERRRWKRKRQTQRQTQQKRRKRKQMQWMRRRIQQRMRQRWTKKEGWEKAKVHHCH